MWKISYDITIVVPRVCEMSTRMLCKIVAVLSDFFYTPSQYSMTSLLKVLLW